jgi:hypothetical protein
MTSSQDWHRFAPAWTNRSGTWRDRASRLAWITRRSELRGEPPVVGICSENPDLATRRGREQAPAIDRRPHRLHGFEPSTLSDLGEGVDGVLLEGSTMGWADTVHRPSFGDEWRKRGAFRVDIVGPVRRLALPRYGPTSCITRRQGGHAAKVERLALHGRVGSASRWSRSRGRHAAKVGRHQNHAGGGFGAASTEC